MRKMKDPGRHFFELPLYNRLLRAFNIPEVTVGCCHLLVSLCACFALFSPPPRWGISIFGSLGYFETATSRLFSHSHEGRNDVSQPATISLSRLTAAEFYEFMRPRLRAFINEHSVDIPVEEIDEETALRDMYDLVHGQSSLDWHMTAVSTPALESPEISAACAAAVVGVTIGAVALVFQAAGVPASVTRAVGTTVVEDAIAASPALATTLEAQVGALVTADGVVAQAKAIFSLFGSISNVVSIGKIISAIKNELSWYQWVLMGVVITAQLTLWFTTGGTAAIAELVLFGAAIAGLVISAQNAYSVCQSNTLLTGTSAAPTGSFVSVDASGSLTYAMTEDGTLFLGQPDGTWAPTGDTVQDFSVAPPSATASAGTLWVIDQNGDADGQISCIDLASGTKTSTNGQASLINTADDGTTWAIQGDQTALQWDADQQTWTAGAALDQVAVSSATLVYALVLSSSSSDATVVLTSDGGNFALLAQAPEATDVLQIATNAAGDLVCITTDNNVFEFTGDGSADPWVQIGGDDLTAEFISIRNPATAWLIDTDGNLSPIGPIVVPTALGWDTEDVWDETKSTHLYIVNRAAQLVATSSDFAAEFVGGQIQPFLQQAQAGPFRTGMCQGLYDADFLAPYNDPNWIGQATWKSHFYDQSTGTNYEGETAPTALTNGTTYLTQALEALRTDPDVSHGGYALGLALHYFTDLTQPMHAANYTYLSSFPFGYHTDFEIYMMSMQATVAQPTVTGFVPQQFDNFAEVFTSTSKYSKDTYFTAVDQAHKYASWKWSPAQWHEALQPLLPEMLNDAVAATAQLLYQFLSELAKSGEHELTRTAN